MQHQFFCRALVGLALAGSFVIGAPSGYAASACDQKLGAAFEPLAQIAAKLAGDSAEGLAEPAKMVVKAAALGAKQAGDKTCIERAKVFQNAGSELAKAKTLDAARESLKLVSDVTKDTYAQLAPAAIDIVFCPMAKAYWLQTKGGAVRNPYYGKQMLECGMVQNQKVLKP